MIRCARQIALWVMHRCSAALRCWCGILFVVLAARTTHTSKQQQSGPFARVRFFVCLVDAGLDPNG